MMAKAAASGDALAVRAAVLDIYDAPLAQLTCPEGLNDFELCVAAGLLELLAERSGQSPPSWAELVPGATRPCFLLRSAERMPRLRHLCETEGPSVLRRRNLFAPPNYLTFV